MSVRILADRSDTVRKATIEAIAFDFERTLINMGLKNDSINPELIFILRWETLQVPRASSASNHETMQTYGITNPVYSPFENTSDRLSNNVASGRMTRYYDEESFYSIQAINVVTNDVVWLTRIYTRKNGVLSRESINTLSLELAKVFAEIQLKTTDKEFKP